MPRDASRDRRTPDPPYLAPYRAILDAHGPSFEATGWRSRQMQTTRFDVLIDLADLAGRSVIDAGSGQGALCDRLVERGVEHAAYVGLDAMPEMIEQSASRGLPGARFEVCDIAREPDAFSRWSRAAGGPGADVIVFSGSLNTMDDETAMRTLGRAWDAAEEALLFNFLSDRAPAALLAQDPAPARRLDTLALLDWALSRTPLVRFRQDYLGGHDATIAMFKPR
ncbi:MAG: methyltransferase domain-containing protein [Planctomycetota bacterium]|nr:MAG: methyltransferase domain-containing protein [Planctomycetota bacterium]